MRDRHVGTIYTNMKPDNEESKDTVTCDLKLP